MVEMLGKLEVQENHESDRACLAYTKSCFNYIKGVLCQIVPYRTVMSMGWSDKWIRRVGSDWVGSKQMERIVGWVGSDWVKFLVGQAGSGPDLGGS